MKVSLIFPKQISLPWFKLLIIIVLTLGIFFRFVNLDRKIYWGDEASSTSLRISGYTSAEIEQALKNRIVSVEDILKYQRPSPEKGLIDTVKALTTDDAHPPLYMVLTRVWMQWLGDSVAVTRSFSALISLLAFSCIYWLCAELFESPLVGWIAIALIAISPFHVLYAQEARMYSLWTVEILLSSAALLQALRTRKKLIWVIYGTVVTLGLYSHLFTGFVAIGHGLYVVITERFRLSKTLIAYLVTSLASLLAFSPWLWVIITNLSNFQSATAWSTQSMSLSSLVTNWIYNLSYVFVDFWYIFTYVPDSPFNWGFGKFLIPLLFILVGYSLYVLFRTTPERVWLFVFTLIGTTALAVILPDILSGGYRSIMGRYFIPCYLGIEIAVAYLFAIQIYAIKIWQQKLWRIILIALISGGILSCAISSQAETWWNKRTTSDDHLHTARIINQASHPLLVTESVAAPLSLSHKLNSKAKLMIVDSSNISKIPDGFSDVFVLEPSKPLRDQLEQESGSKIDIIYKGRKQSLWQLEKK